MDDLTNEELLAAYFACAEVFSRAKRAKEEVPDYLEAAMDKIAQVCELRFGKTPLEIAIDRQRAAYERGE